MNTYRVDVFRRQDAVLVVEAETQAEAQAIAKILVNDPDTTILWANGEIGVCVPTSL